MRLVSFLGCAASAAALAACSTGGGTPPPVPNAPGPVAAALNTTLGPLGYGHPDNQAFRSDLGYGGGANVDEVFYVKSTSLRLTSNGNGFEYADRIDPDYGSTDTVTYDTTDNSFTIDLTQAGVSIQDVIGPIMLADPQDTSFLLNDQLAVLIAAFPGYFPSSGQFNFDPQDYSRDPSGADAAIEALKDGGEEANEFLALLNERVADVLSYDFFSYAGPNGLDWAQLKITGTNSGISTNYVALGYWSYAATDGVPGDYFFGTTLWGKPTPAGEVPDKGTGSYETTIIGWMLRQNAVEQLRGGISLDVNFATGRIEALVDADLAVNGPNGETIFTDFATLSGDGSLVGGTNRFRGVLDGDSDPTLEGGFDGQFYGPTANEIGGSLHFSNTDVAASGSFVGTGTITSPD